MKHTFTYTINDNEDSKMGVRELPNIQKEKIKMEPIVYKIKYSDVVKQMYHANPDGVDHLYAQLQESGIREPEAAVITLVYAGAKIKDILYWCADDGYDALPLICMLMNGRN